MYVDIGDPFVLDVWQCHETNVGQHMIEAWICVICPYLEKRHNVERDCKEHKCNDGLSLNLF